MAENLKKQPSKGILKNSTSFDIQDKQSAPKRQKGNAKWDEMNILATLHPPDKDYGHMKIDEPKTPYNYEGMDGRDPEALDPEELAERIRKCVDSGGSKPPRDESDESDDDLTPEEKAAKHAFESKRKKHYNEYYAVKLARKLLEKDEDEDSQDSEEDQPGPA